MGSRFAVLVAKMPHLVKYEALVWPLFIAVMVPLIAGTFAALAGARAWSKIMGKLLVVAAVTAALASAGSAVAQVYPARALTIVVPAAASAPDRTKMGRKVGDRLVEGEKLPIVGLGDIDAEAMVDGGDEVQEVEGIDIERLAQIRRRVDARRINLGRDVVELFQHHLANVNVTHSLSGSCSSLPISAKNKAPACPSLTL
jgi:hypothetical protein